MTNCPSCNAPLKEERARFCANCGAMVPLSGAPSADPLVGKVIAGRFRLTSVLGEGGMGKVYLAEQKMGASTRKVAVKTLHGDIAGDPQVVQRFQRECDTVNQLTHPNTITLYDFGDWEGTLYIAMEYLQGESVAQALVRTGPFEPLRAERILMQVCGSLHEAHEHGIVHRDLKPENVLLTSRGGARDFVKVLDFGIAKRNEGEDPAASQKLTRQGMVLGTPPYMSPEQFTGQVLDRRSDLYSLGVMAYEMLTGKLPFDAKTPWEWATKHLTTAPEPIEVHDKAGRLHARHKSAIMKALKKNRDDRQANVIEFLQELTGAEDPSLGWGQVTTPAPIGAQAPPPAGVPTPGPVGVPTPGPAPVPFTAVSTPGPTPAAPPGGWVSPGTPGPTPAFPATAWAGAVTPSRSIPTPMTAGGAMVTPAPMPQVSTGGGGGKIAILVVLALLVLGGGSGLAYWVATRPSGPIAQPTPPAPPTPPTPPMPPLGPREVPVGPTPTQPTQPTPPTPPRPTGPDPVVIAPIPPGPNPVPQNPPRGPVLEPVIRPAPPTPPPPTPPPPTPPPTKLTKTGPNAAELQRGRQLAASGVSQARLGNLDAGLAALREATRLAGRNDPTVALLRQTVSVAGGTKVGILIQQRRCLDAQMLFTRLRSAGAGDLARRHFTPDCPAR